MSIFFGERKIAGHRSAANAQPPLAAVVSRRSPRFILAYNTETHGRPGECQLQRVEGFRAQYNELAAAGACKAGRPFNPRIIGSRQDVMV